MNGGEDGGDTTTMIMVVVMFLACNTLALVVNIVETFFQPSKLILNYMYSLPNTESPHVNTAFGESSCIRPRRARRDRAGGVGLIWAARR